MAQSPNINVDTLLPDYVSNKVINVIKLLFMILFKMYIPYNSKYLQKYRKNIYIYNSPTYVISQW